MVNREHTLTPAGNQRCPSKEVVIKWVRECWAGIDANIVKKAFLQTGISCALDGSEDDAIWRNDSVGDDGLSDSDVSHNEEDFNISYPDDE